MDVIVIYLDFQKASYVVPHKRIKLETESVGISDSNV